jgi:hypothetical protein
MSTTIAKTYVENIFLNLPAKGLYGNNKVMHEEAIGSSTVVDLLPQHPKVKGLSPAAAGNRREMAKNSQKNLNKSDLYQTIRKYK